MVWCGVVWCGVVWFGVVWCGVVWCGVVWCGVVWCGVVWCAVVWCGVVWCGVLSSGIVHFSPSIFVNFFIDIPALLPLRPTLCTSIFNIIAHFIDCIRIFHVDLPDHPVLFAVDEFNYWESQSSFRYRQKAVQASEICVPSVLKFASIKKADSENYSLKNGICIGATSAKHPIKKLVTYEDYKSSIPLVIRVPCYSQVELASVISYYQRENLIDPGFRTQDIVAYRMQSG